MLNFASHCRRDHLTLWDHQGLIHSLFSFLTLPIQKNIHHCSAFFVIFPSSSLFLICSNWIVLWWEPGQTVCLPNHVTKCSITGFLLTFSPPVAHVDGQLTLRYCVSGTLSRNTVQRPVCRNWHTLSRKQQVGAVQSRRPACRPGLCFLEAERFVSFPATALWFLGCAARTPLSARSYFPSCWKFCQLMSECLSRNCLLLKGGSFLRATPPPGHSVNNI